MKVGVIAIPESLEHSNKIGVKIQGRRSLIFFKKQIKSPACESREYLGYEK